MESIQLQTLRNELDLRNGEVLEVQIELGKRCDEITIYKNEIEYLHNQIDNFKYIIDDLREELENRNTELTNCISKIKQQQLEKPEKNNFMDKLSRSVNHLQMSIIEKKKSILNR